MQSGYIHHRQVKAWVIATAIVAAIAAIALFRDRGPVTVDSGQRVVMGTFSRVVVVAKDRGKAFACIDAAMQDQQWIEGMMSFHRPGSQLSILNRYGHERPVALPEPLFELIKRAIDLSNATHGGFDPTVGPLVRLWREAGQAGHLPSDSQIQQALERTGCTKLILDPNAMTVRFATDGMMLDLGGIAKGYAVDRSIEILKRMGALGGMVDLGGNIRCFGRPPSSAACWTIGVQDPTKVDTGDQDGIAMVLRLTDQSVATSGHYYRFETIGGKRFSHIIDPRTGQPAQALASVTVIAPDATTADALSTAIAVLGADEGLRLLAELPGVDGILMQLDASGRLTTRMTEGVKRLLADAPRR